MSNIKRVSNYYLQIKTKRLVHYLQAERKSHRYNYFAPSLNPYFVLLSLSFIVASLAIDEVNYAVRTSPRNSFEQILPRRRQFLLILVRGTSNLGILSDEILPCRADNTGIIMM